jgi:hypothetical protein
MQTQLSPVLLASVIAVAMSLGFTYIPGLNAKFAELTKDVKQAIMGGLTILIAIAVYVLACTPTLGFTFVECPTGGIWELVAIIIAALVANQGVFAASPQPTAVKEAKLTSK